MTRRSCCDPPTPCRRRWRCCPSARTARWSWSRTAARSATAASGRLRVAAAIGISGDVAHRADKLLAAGVDVLVLDTAHGHQERMLAALRTVRGLNPTVPVVAGNVVTAAGVDDLADA